MAHRAASGIAELKLIESKAKQKGRKQLTAMLADVGMELLKTNVGVPNIRCAQPRQMLNDRCI